MRRTIFKSSALYSNEEREALLSDFRERLREEGVEETEELLSRELYLNEEFEYDAERANLGIITNNKIIALASLEFWNGTVAGYKILNNALNSVLDYFGCDYIDVYYDGHNIKSSAYHHDGTHHLEFREIREGRNLDILLDKIYNGETVTRDMINYYTKPLGHYLKEIYGW